MTKYGSWFNMHFSKNIDYNRNTFKQIGITIGNRSIRYSGILITIYLWKYHIMFMFNKRKLA